MIKPKVLRPGSRIAGDFALLGWDPALSPHRYRVGKQQFEEKFGVTVVETAHALRDADWLARNPKARADDLMAAFADEKIDGIISTIGGEDSIRTLPYLDLDLIRNNPQGFYGFFGYHDIARSLFQSGPRIVLRSLVYGRICRKRRDCFRIWWILFGVPSFLLNRLVLLCRTEQDGQLNICRGRILKTNPFVEN